jgi:hypothetical protein
MWCLLRRSSPGHSFALRRQDRKARAGDSAAPDRDGLQVQVYAGRDPLTGRKRWVSRQVPGKGRATWKEAKQVEAALLAEVGAGRHRGSKAKTVAELLESWFEWRQSVRPIAPARSTTTAAA